VVVEWRANLSCLLKSKARRRRVEVLRRQPLERKARTVTPAGELATVHTYTSHYISEKALSLHATAEER